MFLVSPETLSDSNSCFHLQGFWCLYFWVQPFDGGLEASIYKNGNKKNKSVERRGKLHSSRAGGCDLFSGNSPGITVQ